MGSLVGTRDLLRHETVQTAGIQLSDVACVAVDFALAIVMQQRLDAEARSKAPGTFAVIGTGNLGGREMSYADAVGLLQPCVGATTGHLHVDTGRSLRLPVERHVTDRHRAAAADAGATSSMTSFP